MKGKVIKVTFSDGREEMFFQTQNAFREWYMEMGYSKTKNCNLHQMLHGTSKAYEKHGISSVTYVQV